MAHAQLGVYCRRTVAVYYAFDGALPARKAQLEKALQTEGVIGLVACPSPGIMNLPPKAPPTVCGSFDPGSEPAWAQQ